MIKFVTCNIINFLNNFFNKDKYKHIKVNLNITFYVILHKQQINIYIIFLKENKIINFLKNEMELSYKNHVLINKNIIEKLVFFNNIYYLRIIVP